MMMPRWTLAIPLVVGLAAEMSEGQSIVDGTAIRAALADEWLSHGRDYAETRYSPLTQIHRGNVRNLRVAWSSDFGNLPGNFQLESTPLVSDGVIYATGPWSLVFAMDARTGALKWRWDPGLVRGGRPAGGPVFCCGPVNRGVALHGGKVYVGLLDGRLVALDAKSGRVIWARQTTPVGSDYSITGAPRVVKDLVIIGNAGAEFGVRGYITAYDAETGDQVWRTYSVPGDPSKPFESPALERAATTWRGEWWRLGGGGTVWDSFAFDADADLLYAGVGNGSPWSRDHRSAGVGDNLYLASIIALRPDTGELVWFYQTAPGDDWDYGATQSLILADLEIGGRLRKVIMQAPKNGFFYVIDRITGEFISGQPYVGVSWASSIEPKTGRPVETTNARYGARGAWVSPGSGGARTWEPMSWNPITRLAYFPARTNMAFFRTAPTLEPVPGRANLGIAPRSRDEPPAPGPTRATGSLVAWDPIANAERWRLPIETPLQAGTLTTAGNLLFTGVSNGAFRAYDATTGERLWETQLQNGIAAPITYRLDGRQYITVLAGWGESAKMWSLALDPATSPR